MSLISPKFANDKFLVQHDMENMYTWAFKERPENALGKMQLWSYMNGHSRLVEPQFPFSVDRGFVRSHRMQHKQYQRSSNPQCVHGIRSPNLMVVGELDQKKWMELNFSIPDEASDFEAWRNLQTTEFELEKPLSQPNISPHPHPKKLLNGSSLNLSSQIHHYNSDVVDLSPICNKHRKNLFPHRMEEDYYFPTNSHTKGMEMHQVEPSWRKIFAFQDSSFYVCVVLFM